MQSGYRTSCSAVYGAPCKVYNVQCTEYRTECSVQCAVCNVQYALCIVHCTVYNNSDTIDFEVGFFGGLNPRYYSVGLSLGFGIVLSGRAGAAAMGDAPSGVPLGGTVVPQMQIMGGAARRFPVRSSSPPSPSSFVPFPFPCVLSLVLPFPSPFLL